MTTRAAPDAELRTRLLRWYDENRRELPWRAASGQRPDPYRIWVSEVMLQQTRVDVVRPYFQRWMERFPTLDALAAASHDAVMKQWEGLGYYSRARNLHRAVREVADRFGGRVPDEPSDFRALPGVGRYTSGAVLSIAFGRAEPVVDGNVRRVFARWMDEPEPGDRDLWSRAEALVEGERPGDLNQALMELGATVCTPHQPRCSACPVREWCAAHAAGTQADRPAPRRARPLPAENTGTAVVVRNGEVLLARRRRSGRLGGMWEFPGTTVGPGEEIGGAVARAALDAAGLTVRPAKPLCTVEHVFTHVRVTYHAVICSLLSGELVAGTHEQVQWVPLSEVRHLALPRAQQRIAATLLASRNGEAASD